jgi:hypothetical protein
MRSSIFTLSPQLQLIFVEAGESSERVQEKSQKKIKPSQPGAPRILIARPERDAAESALG